MALVPHVPHRSLQHLLQHVIACDRQLSELHRYLDDLVDLSDSMTNGHAAAAIPLIDQAIRILRRAVFIKQVKCLQPVSVRNGMAGAAKYEANVAATVIAALKDQKAWRPCVQVLSLPPAAHSQQLLETLCAQKLAAVARALPSVCTKEEQDIFPRAIEAVLAKHLPPGGRPSVWRQLCLALVSSQLWLGQWTPRTFLSHAPPATVLMELLALPPELLFRDRGICLIGRQTHETIGGRGIAPV
eukprot:s637_g21.t1